MSFISSSGLLAEAMLVDSHEKLRLYVVYTYKVVGHIFRSSVEAVQTDRSMVSYINDYPTEHYQFSPPDITYGATAMLPRSEFTRTFFYVRIDILSRNNSSFTLCHLSEGSGNTQLSFPHWH